MSTSPFTLHWGIMATGNIAETFSRDLLKDPTIRQVSDVAHKIQAVAASSSLAKAQKFANTITGGADHSIKSYGSYKELVEDPDVDIVYVATPHSHHYDCVLLALRAGKHVCCEVCFRFALDEM
jgi:predicted dehydrogenase